MELEKFKKKVQNFRGERKKRIKIPSTMKMTLSSLAIETSFFDVDGKCFPIDPIDTIISKMIADEKVVKCLSNTIESFEYYPKTGVISILDKDLTALALNKNGMATQVCKALSVEGLEGVASITRFADDKTLVLRRSGFSGAFHKFVNGAFVSGSAISTFTTTAASHVSGVTGLPLIVSTPGIIIFTPMVGGLFFGSLERLTAGTLFGTVFGFSRDVCLVIPRIAEVTLNNVFPGPLFQLLSIDAPVNFTAYLRFGESYETVPDEVKKNILATIVGKLNDYFNKP